MIVVGNRATQDHFLKAQFVIFRCQKYVKKGYIETTKKNLPWDFKKVSWIALFPTTVLLNTYKHHHTKTLFIFTIFVSLSRSRFICVYLCDLFFIFIFIFIMITYIIAWIQIHLHSCLFYKNMSYYFWMITWIKNVNIFQIPKVQPQRVV